MNDQSYNEPRLDEPPAVDIINARKSYCSGKMEVPIRGTAHVRYPGVLDRCQHAEYQEMRS